jgi:hypothetical protein
MHADSQPRRTGRLGLYPGPTSFAVDAHVGRLQPEMPGDSGRRCMLWMHVRDEDANAALAEPCQNTAGRLRRISPPLIADRDYPCELGRHPLARAANRRLDSADGTCAVPVTNDPVQPALLAIAGLAHDQPRVPAAELLQRLGFPAGELVQAAVVQQRCHLLSVRNTQRLDEQARSLDQRGARPAGRQAHGHTVSAARASTARARAESRTPPELLSSGSVIGSRPWEAGVGCRRPVSPTVGRTLQGRFAPFPSPKDSVPRPATSRRFGLCQPPDPHKEGTKDERISSRS